MTKIREEKTHHASEDRRDITKDISTLKTKIPGDESPRVD